MNKKQVILTGRLAAPLCEGRRAWIRHHSGLVCTSRVVRIQSLTDRKAVFETMNSMYHVSLETYPFVMELPEAMCAQYDEWYRRAANAVLLYPHLPV